MVHETVTYIQARVVILIVNYKQGSFNARQACKIITNQMHPL